MTNTFDVVIFWFQQQNKKNNFKVNNNVKLLYTNAQIFKPIQLWFWAAYLMFY